MSLANHPALRTGWIAKGMTLLKTFGPYALVEFVLPGGTLLAIGLWLYRNRRQLGQGVAAGSTADRAAADRAARSRALHWARAFVSGAAVTLLAACTVGPNFTKPDAPATAYSRAVPPAGGARDFSYGGEVAGDWYRLFHSDALDQLVRQALRNSPDLEAARHGLAAAQDELRAVSGAALPQINAAGNIGRGHINGSQLYEPVNAFHATGNQFEVGPSLAYNLDPFGGIRRSIESQRAQTAAVQDQLRDTYVTLVDQVVLTAFDYAAVDAQIRVTRALVGELRAQYNLNVQLENAGKIIHSDTLQAETQLENVRATLPGLEEQRDTYRDALARLTGQTPDEFRMPVLTLADFTLPGRLPVSLPSALVEQRPDVLAAEENLHAASAQIGVATAARLPQLTLSAQYAQESSTLSDLFTKAGGVWSAGLGVAAPLFHGGTLAAQEDAAKQRYDQSLATYRGTVIGAFVDVADALQSLQHDADSYAAHKRALEAALASQDLADEEYHAGKYTELQVLTVQQQYQDAALAQVQADAQRFTDTAALFRALGGGWWDVRDRAPLSAANTSDSDRNHSSPSGSSHD